MKSKKDIAFDDKISSFPSETLNDCREIIGTMIKRKGETTIPFKEIAIILGRPLGTITLPISTCTQYGVLENVHGSGYRPTKLFDQIENPVFAADRQTAILEALSNAPLYRRLIDEFNGKILPDEEGMTNYLVKTFGVKPYLIQKVVKTFFRNFNEHHLIDNSNRLRFFVSVASENPKAKDETVIESKIVDNPETPEATPERSNNKMFEQAIDLGEIDVAYLKYPRSITMEQVELLRIHLEATLTALEARFKKTIKKEQPEGHS